MEMKEKHKNHLKGEKSPYLLQHAENPVDWFPWGQEAFNKAKQENKPVFLSIGYSTCHWCHVMAHESFEDDEIADILNKYFVSIKVDKEERPDIDSIYMSVCQALTGSGGWPTSIFLTPEQKPFFAGTYFPKYTQYGRVGFRELLLSIHKHWETEKEALEKQADRIIEHLDRKDRSKNILRNISLYQSPSNVTDAENNYVSNNSCKKLITEAIEQYKELFDEQFGGFGDAPKFPMAHNLLFLMRHYEKVGDEEALYMAVKTLLQMYKGGIFDHIGGGFSRYSTDRFFLVPHFEKMLYDNALLMLAYCKAYQLTKNPIHRTIAEKTASYILREMTSPEGGFYSAQDADSEGEEGKFYLFTPDEVIKVIGRREGKNFNKQFDIIEKGNFEGKNIPNLLKSNNLSGFAYEPIAELYEYRKSRHKLHLDYKIITSWNGLMIAAMCNLYRVTKNGEYLNSAIKAEAALKDRRFLDDYANEAFGLLALYEATLDNKHLNKAKELCDAAIQNFFDAENGGFFIYGKDDEQLILRPKETYDGAIFSGNSAMAYNLVKIYLVTGDEVYEKAAKTQIEFMMHEAEGYPSGYAFYLTALSDYLNMPGKVTIVLGEQEIKDISCHIPLDYVITVLEKPTEEYSLLNNKTTYYVCKGNTCYPATNEIIK